MNSRGNTRTKHVSPPGAASAAFETDTGFRGNALQRRPAMQVIDASSLVQNYMNSKITSLLMSKLYGQSATAAVPDSTRRPFVSRMRLDSRADLQGAQNMEDAAALVGVAQSDVTAIKDKLNSMLAKTIEAATLDPMENPDYASTNSALKKLAQDISDIAKNSSFNGIRLLDGSAGMDNDGRIQLQAGNSPRDQVMVNMLDSSVAAGQVLGGQGEINLNNLGALFDAGGAWEVTDQASAKAARANLEEIIDRITGVEAQYSYDIKSLKNMSLLLQNQADILDAVQKNHAVSGSDDKEGTTPSAGASSSLADLLGGNIMSAVS